MPTIPSDAPRGNYKFYDQPVTLPHILTAGHTLTEAEAKYMNQAYATTVGNRYGAAIRKALTALDAERTAAFKAGTYTGPLDETGKKPVPAKATAAELGWNHQAEIDEVFSAFEPGISTRGPSSGGSSDPIASEVRRLAGVAVRDLYKAKHVNYQAMLKATQPDGKSAYFHHVDQYVAAKGEQLRAIVETQFAAMAAAKDVGGELDFGSEAA